jgi:hypothetical protein
MNLYCIHSPVPEYVTEHNSSLEIVHGMDETGESNSRFFCCMRVNPETMDKQGLQHDDNRRDTRIVVLNALGGIDVSFCRLRNDCTRRDVPMQSYSNHILGAQPRRVHRTDEWQRRWTDMIVALRACGIGLIMTTLEVAMFCMRFGWSIGKVVKEGKDSDDHREQSLVCLKIASLV